MDVMDVFSAGLFDRLLLERSQLLDYAMAGELSVGDSKSFRLSEKFVSLNPVVSANARLVQNGDEAHVRASYVSVDYPKKMSSPQVDFIDFFSAIADNKVVPDIMPRMLSVTPHTEVDVDAVSSSEHRAESALLPFLAKKGSLALVNPSRGTLYRALELQLDFVVEITSDEFEKSYIEMLQDIFFHMDRKPCIFYEMTEAEYRFCGSNGKQMTLPNSVSLCPNPYGDMFSMVGTCLTTELGIEMSYRRRGRDQKSYVLYEPDYIVYTPSSVAHFLGLRSPTYFLYSTFRIQGICASEASSFVRHRFLSSLPEYRRVRVIRDNGIENSYMVSYDDTTVYDFSGPEQWYSKWSLLRDIAVHLRLSLPVFVEDGPYCVSLMDSSPHRTGILTGSDGDYRMYDGVPEPVWGDYVMGTGRSVLYSRQSIGNAIHYAPGSILNYEMDVRGRPMLHHSLRDKGIHLFRNLNDLMAYLPGLISDLIDVFGKHPDTCSQIDGSEELWKEPNYSQTKVCSTEDLIYQLLEEAKNSRTLITCNIVSHKAGISLVRLDQWLLNRYEICRTGEYLSLDFPIIDEYLNRFVRDTTYSNYHRLLPSYVVGLMAPCYRFRWRMPCASFPRWERFLEDNGIVKVSVHPEMGDEASGFIHNFISTRYYIPVALRHKKKKMILLDEGKGF